VHRGRRVKGFVEAHRRIRVEPLPPYVPELNPVDKGWGWMKLHRLANHGLAQLDELGEAVERTYEGPRSEQQRLRSFVRATGLPIRI
jgi:hypothetical protein